MILATLHFIYSSNMPDDVVHVLNPTPENPSALRVVFKVGETGKKLMFYMPKRRLLHYIADILESLRRDIDPLENIQITTCMHPAVLYHVSDMDDRSTRHLILDMVETVVDAHFA